MSGTQCFISKKEMNPAEMISGALINPNLFEFIRKKYPGFTGENYLSLNALNDVRKEYMEAILTEEMGELSQLEKDVIESISKNEILSENIEEDEKTETTLGERVADRVADFGGSWPFIIIFFIFLFAWMILNAIWMHNKGYDPYPFILLNLILSCLAAIQAPIIMMSQNRQEIKDRKHNEHDYKINLKAELEIRLLNEKMDHVLIHQNKKLLEIQQIQIEMLKNVLEETVKKNGNSG
jgi:uncharacterized membrane protein